MITSINEFKQYLKESLSAEDQALDNLSKVGDINKLSALDRLILYTLGGEHDKISKLSLLDIYKSKGEFEKFKIKVKVKDVNQQQSDHEFSKQNAGKEGYLYPPIHYSDEREPYAVVRFDEFTPDPNMKGGGTYEEYPIMLDNLIPVAYVDVHEDFDKYQAKVKQEQDEFRRNFGLDTNESMASNYETIADWPDGVYKGFIKGYDVYSDAIDSGFKTTTGYRNAFPIMCYIVVKAGHAIVYSKHGILFSDVETENEWREKFGKGKNGLMSDPDFVKYSALLA